MTMTAGSATHGATASAALGPPLPPKFQHAVNDDTKAIRLTNLKFGT
jgi:hypothetical protein